MDSLKAPMKKHFVFTVFCYYSFIFYPSDGFASNNKDTLRVPIHSTHTNLVKYSDTRHNPERIYYMVDNSLCAEWEITKNYQITYDYERAKEIKEDGVFYYYDEENEMIQAQNYLPDGQIIIKTLFRYQDVCYIISVICCKKSLAENKKVIKSLHEKILNDLL